MTTKVWSKDEILKLLLKSDEMVRRSLVQLYKRQEPDEQAEHVTKHRNKMGFNAMDADLCSSLAQKVLSGMPLSHGETWTARFKLKKYANQLTEIANNHRR